MAAFSISDFARITLGGATDATSGQSLSAQQIDDVISYLKSPASGPGGVTSYADYLEAQVRDFPPELPAGRDYVAFSGADGRGKGNYFNARDYSLDVGNSAGIIGDTPYGARIREFELNGDAHPEFKEMTARLKTFMDSKGVVPYYKDHAGALLDLMWNAGSPKYLENAVATGKPLLAFVENAPTTRAFVRLELLVALEHPDLRINGYPMSAFQPDPVEFASKSAAEYQAMERSLAEPFVVEPKHPETMEDARAKALRELRNFLKPVDGYDAVEKTLYDRPIADFKNLSLEEMAHTRATWLAAGRKLPTVPHVEAEAPDHVVRQRGEPGSARGSPTAASTVAEAASESAPHPVRAGMSPAAKAGVVAGVAMLAHDFSTSGHKWVEMRLQGNEAAADSTAVQFVGRNVGGALGGFVLGASVGAAAGSWTGPAALISGLGGGVLGTYLGERWADQQDINRVYIQEDPFGRKWTRDPADPDGRWFRASNQQQVQGLDLGTGMEVRPVQNAQGDNVTFRSDYVATGTLERQLNWKAARASYEMGLGTPPEPKDPYRQSAKGETVPPREHNEIDREFVRNPSSGQWERHINQLLDGRVEITRREPVSDELALALDERSRVVIAQNAANTPAAMAARYMVAYEEGRWSDFGDKDNPSIPTAIQNARDDADTLRASDGHRYTRQEDGSWVSNGIVFNHAANPNLREELEVTWRSQSEGIAGLTDVAEQARANAVATPEGVRGQLESLYAKNGIERTEEQLAATTAVLQQSLGNQLSDAVLEIIPDPRTHAPSAESAIAAFSDDGGNRMVLRGTATVEDVSQYLSIQQQTAKLDEAPVPNAPERRIDALSPDEWDAHQQALREANRQGVSTDEAGQLAMAAALQARNHHAGAGQDPERDPVDTRQLDSLQNAAALPPQPEAAAVMATAVPSAQEEPQTPVRSSDDGKANQAEVAEKAREERQHQEAGVVAEREADRSRATDVAAEPAVAPAQEVTHQEAAAVQTLQTAAIAAALNQQREAEEPRREATPALEERTPPATAAHDELHEEQQRHQQAAELEADEVRPEAVEDHEPIQAADSSLPELQEEAQRLAGKEPEQPEIAEQHEEVERLPELQVAEERESEVMAEPQWMQDLPAEPTRLTAQDRGHPDYALYQQIRGYVTELDASHNRTYDATSERLTGSLLVLAKANGLERVDHVVLSRATADQPAGQNVFVVQGELDNPGHRRASMDTVQAISTPHEESMAKLDVLIIEDQERAQQVTNQQQEEHDKMQQELQIAAASMGY